MEKESNYSIDFGALENCLDTMFFSDDKSREIITKAGFTKSQISIINTLIISALKSYDLQTK